MSNVFDLRARVSADASPFNKAMDSSATSVSSALSAINSAASMFIGNGVVRVFSMATNAAYEFGQVMADISSISDVGIQQLSKNIKQLDNVYGSMSSVGNSIYNIISSGFDRSEEELLSIIKNVGQASKSIRADLYSTANVFTTVANAYDLSADQFKTIADLLFVTVKEGKAEGSELARTLGLVVNTASEAGLSFAEMSAVISTLSRTQTTSQAMIGFNQMLNAMIKPSKEAADTAKQFGIEFGAAALKSKGFTAIIKEMHDKLQGNVEAINKISGPIRAMRAVVSLTGKQYEDFIDILEKAEAQIGTGVAMEAFAKQTNTAKQALENLKVQIDKTFVGIGQDLEPITKWLIEFDENILKAFSASDGIGKWSIYVTALIGTFKGIYKVYNKCKPISTMLVTNTSNTTDKAKTYADHMERAKNATKDAAIATSNISKNLTNAVVKFTNGKVLGSEVIYQSKGYTPNTITDSQRANVLRTMQDRLAKARESVAAAQKAHTPNVKPFYDAKSDIQRAMMDRDASQSKFFEAMDLRKEAQRLLKDKQWSAQNLVAQLPSFQRNSSYGKELQANLDAQLQKAQADVNHMMEVETGAREIYYKSEKSLVNAQLRFDAASKAYYTSVSKLKQAQAELQSMAKAEKAIVTSYRNTASSEGNVESASSTTKDLTMPALKKANARKLKATRRAAMSFEQQDALIARYNRRFKKNYEYLGERINRTGIDWKRSFANILGTGGILRKLHNGFFALTSVLAAWETGLVIGNAIRKKFKLDDMFVSARTKRMESENNAMNVAIVRQATFRYLKNLETQKKVNAAEMARLASTIALAKSQDELTAVQNKIKDKLEGKVKEPPKSYADRQKELQADFENKIKDIEIKPAGVTTRMIMAASDTLNPRSVISIDEKTGKKTRKMVGGLYLPTDSIKFLNNVRGLHERDQLRKKYWADDLLAISAGWVTRDPDAPIKGRGRMRREYWHDPSTVYEISDKLRADLLTAFTSDRWSKNIDDTINTFISGYEQSEMERRSDNEGRLYHIRLLRAHLRNYAQRLKDIRMDTSAEEKEELREAKRDDARKEYAEKMLGAVGSSDTVGDVQYKSEETEAYKTRGLKNPFSNMDTLDDAIKDFIGSHEMYIKQTESMREMQKAYDQTISELRKSGVSEDHIKTSSKYTIDALNSKSDTITAAKDIKDDAEKALVKAYDTRLKTAGEILKSKGIYEKDYAYSAQMRKVIATEIKRLDMMATETVDDSIRGVYARIRNSLYDKAGEYRGLVYEDKRNLRQAKYSGGLLSDSGLIRGEISDIQDEMNSIRGDIKTATQQRQHFSKGVSTYVFYTNQIANAQRKLQEASLRLRENFNKLSEKSNEVREGLMNTIQGFTQQRDTTGKMTNDALWHSVNLASRMGSMVRSQPYMISTRSLPNRQKAAQMRQQAQGAISASVDAWIMSQKYAEANVGKTVADIYTFMKQNNTIVVRNK